MEFVATKKIRVPSDQTTGSFILRNGLRTGTCSCEACQKEMILVRLLQIPGEGLTLEREERELRSAKLLLHVMVDPFVREMFTADLAACRGSDISPVILLFCRSGALTPSQ